MGTFENFILVMMSDGEASYPQAGIDAIKKFPNFENIKFKVIGYGGEANMDNVLKPMAVELQGTFESVLEPHQLSDAFIEMIPNIYRQ